MRPHMLSSLSLVLLASGCAPVSEGDGLEPGAMPVVVGSNDFRLVGPQGPGVPSRYERLYPAVGQMHRYYVSSGGTASSTCTVSYLGRGVVMTAGHCLDAPSSEVRDAVCPGVVVNWASIAGAPATLTSTCQRVLRARDDGAGTDYAFFEVFPPPTRSVEFDARAGGSVAAPTRATMFGHPSSRPLTWSGTCALTTPYGSIFPHQCDSESGSSGAPLFNDATLAVVGINLGTDTALLNYGRYLSATPAADVYASRAGWASGVMVESATTTLRCSGVLSSRDDTLALMQAHNGFRAATATASVPAGCTFAGMSVQYRCGSGGALLGAGTSDPLRPSLALSCGGGATEQPPYWTLFASEEYGGPETSCHGALGHSDLPRPRAIDGVACRGSFCDDVSVRCPSTERAPITGAPSWTAPFSEENPMKLCPAGSYVTGLRCTGASCDNLALQCAPSSRAWGPACTRLPAFSEEQSSRTCPASTSVVGIQCTGRFCDDLTLYCC